jgi:hypothetical protein
MMMKAVLALLAAGALALAAPAAADPPVKHKTPRHVHRTVRPPGPPDYGVPGYNYGGPMFSTCDRINADRMLAGTCR